MKNLYQIFEYTWIFYITNKEFNKNLSGERCYKNPKPPQHILELVEKLFRLGGKQIGVQHSATSINKEKKQFAIRCSSQLFYKEILKHGKEFGGLTISVKPMQTHMCHWKVIDMWRAAPKNLHVVTGFALAQGIWFQHSWLVNVSKNKIIDPLAKCDKYFGWLIEHNHMEDYSRKRTYLSGE